MMSEPKDALTLVHQRNAFYRDSYRRVTQAFLLSLLLCLLSLFLLVYLIVHPPKPRYFAVDPSGRMTPLVPLKQPNMAPSALLQWASQAAITSYSYNFVNYRQELQAAAEFFTPRGWRSFEDALSSSNNLKAIVDKKLVVSAVATGAPVILWQGTWVDGSYAWRVQMPLKVSYQSATQLIGQSVVVTMLIKRISTLYSARGIGIEQFVVQESG